MHCLSNTKQLHSNCCNYRKISLSKKKSIFILITFLSHCFSISCSLSVVLSLSIQVRAITLMDDCGHFSSYVRENVLIKLHWYNVPSWIHFYPSLIAWHWEWKLFIHDKKKIIEGKIKFSILNDTKKKENWRKVFEWFSFVVFKKLEWARII